jgi:hypothetical protein
MYLCWASLVSGPFSVPTKSGPVNLRIMDLLDHDIKHRLVARR